MLLPPPFFHAQVRPLLTSGVGGRYKGDATEEEEEEEEGGCNISPRPKGEITKPIIFVGNYSNLTRKNAPYASVTYNTKNIFI